MSLLHRLKCEPGSSFHAGCYSVNKHPHRKGPIGTFLAAYTVLLLIVDYQ